ncbi:hypothetical protein [Leptospira idonii]|uniref:Lipoprotein n=1 Tax=Leptospira idonii TaxID=1193500 RepID=A0A4R9LW66_9LEPT|nr:hypothetical protein [Leptospira idonii]TGN17313.1 hypothetical protein EHS15_17395 [Leptospira idonii]
MKLTTKLTIVLVALAFFAACENGDKVDKSVADTNLLLALAQKAQIDDQIEIKGTYIQSNSCSNGSCPAGTTTSLTISSNLGTKTGYLYVDYGSFSVNAEIVEYSNTDRVFYYKTRGQSNISAFLWVITESNEILTCDVFNGKPTLAETKADLASRRAAGTVSTTNPKTTGCNNFGFNLQTKAF